VSVAGFRSCQQWPFLKLLLSHGHLNRFGRSTSPLLQEYGFASPFAQKNQTKLRPAGDVTISRIILKFKEETT
jgi:hypothetical protein